MNMATASKKEIKELDVEQRKALFESEIRGSLEKHGFEYSVELAYTRQGIVPRLMLIDLHQEDKGEKLEDNKTENAEEKPKK